MLRVLMLGTVICALAGCAPVSPGNAPAVATATSTPPAASGSTSPASAGSATMPATLQPAAAPTLAQTAGTVTPAGTVTAAMTVTPAVTPVEARTPTVTTPEAASSVAPATGAAATATQPVIVLERSGGFAGRTQTWTVYADGQVVSGQGERQVAPELVSQFVAGLSALGFFNLQDAYGQNTQCRDCYNYRLTVNSGGQTKTVSFVDNPADMPLGLGEAMEQLNSLLASAK